MRFYFCGSYQSMSVSLHPEAHVLLDYLRGITAHVYMLTIAVAAYAKAANKLYNLGFKPSQIFDRDVINLMKTELVSDKVKNCTHAFLIDNLPVQDNFSKTKFINYACTRDRGMKMKYVQVNEFYPGWSTPWKFDDVQNEIEEALK